MTPTPDPDERGSNLAEIRQRDRDAVARIGNPASDLLLRAEMDRRWLLGKIDDLAEAATSRRTDDERPSGTGLRGAVEDVLAAAEQRQHPMDPRNAVVYVEDVRKALAAHPDAAAGTTVEEWEECGPCTEAHPASACSDVDCWHSCPSPGKALADVLALIEQAERGEGIVLAPGFSTYYTVETGLLRAAIRCPKPTKEER